MRSQGILETLATMSAPTMIRAPPTAYGGMLAVQAPNKKVRAAECEETSREASQVQSAQ